MVLDEIAPGFYRGWGGLHLNKSGSSARGLGWQEAIRHSYARGAILDWRGRIIYCCGTRSGRGNTSKSSLTLASSTELQPYTEPEAFALVIGSVVAPWELSEAAPDSDKTSD